MKNESKNSSSKFEGLRNPNVDSYISLKNINKVYPNGFQAVYDFNIEIKPKEFIVFVGPSGCGKSTTLRMIAGLEDITAGDLYIDQIYSNNLTPKDRDIAMVFQNYALYPHMTVYDNMAFGLKMRHVPTEEIDKRVKEAAEILDLTQLLDRKPRQLSGGQMQRVALGRTIVRKAKAFLMDEPLSNLDAKLRVTMRSEIIKLHQRLNTTSIYVTHDQTEAMTMATRIVVMNKGHIQQIGEPEIIYNHPSNLFVATFIGTPAMNILPAHYGNGVISFSDGFKINLDENRKNEIDNFFKKEIETLNKRLENIDFEIELLPHAIEKGKKIDDDENNENKEVHEFDSDEERAIKAHNAVSKAVLKGSNQFKLKNIFKKNKLPTFDELKAQKIEEIKTLISNYQKCLESGFDCKFGIRPEHVDLAKNKTLFEHCSNEFKLDIEIAELLGNEYYIHSTLIGKEFVSRITNDKVLKQGETLDLVFNLDRIHIFDDYSNKCIF